MFHLLSIKKPQSVNAVVEAKIGSFAELLAYNNIVYGEYNHLHDGSILNSSVCDKKLFALYAKVTQFSREIVPVQSKLHCATTGILGIKPNPLQTSMCFESL